MVNKSKKIFVAGVSGVGKSTVAKELSSRCIRVIDVDTVPGLCSWFDLSTGEKATSRNTDSINDKFMDEHDYRCDIQKLKEMLDQSEEDIFVFGNVGDNSNFLPLFDTVLLLQCSAETQIERLKTRNTNSFGKDPSVHPRILKWKKILDGLMIEAGAKVINTERSLEEVVEDVMKYTK
ncbi:AAA family ATPase [Candidatus Nomurabacteria bacterium]|nr:AAA family ATPase [Candidatus Nomurabacteria bacterium]